MRNELRRRHFLGGFTLIELLCATFVATIVLSLLASLSRRSTREYKRVVQEMDARVEARAVLDFIARDVGAYAGGWWSKNRREGEWSYDEMSFFVRLPKGAQLPDQAESELCYVYYYIFFTRDSQEGGSPKIFRRLLSSREVFERVSRGESFDDFRPDPLVDEPLADFIVSFEVRALREGGEAWLPEGGSPQPRLIEVSLTMTHDDMRAILLSWDDWRSSEGALGKVGEVEANAHLFRYQTRWGLGQ